MENYVIPKILKFGELSYKGGSVRVRITDVKWGKYKDMYGNEIDFQRGNEKELKISDRITLVSSSHPALDRVSEESWNLFVWGNDRDEDSESARYNSSDYLELHDAFEDIQKLQIEEESSEEEESKEPIVSEDLPIEETSNSDF